MGQFDAGQAGEVGEQIFRRSGYQKQQKENAFYFFVIFEKFDGFQLLFIDKQLDEGDAEAAHQKKDHNAGQRRGKIADQTALPDAERVSGTDLKRSAGDDGGEDLKDYHPDEGEHAENALPLYPDLEFPGIGDQSHHGFSDEVSHHKKKENGENCQHNLHLLFRGKCFPGSFPVCHRSSWSFLFFCMSFRLFTISVCLMETEKMITQQKTEKKAVSGKFRKP